MTDERSPNSVLERNEKQVNDYFLDVLKTFVKEKGLVRFQIDSYNDFITNRIPKIIKEIGEIKPEVPELGEFKIKLGEFRIGKENWGPWFKEADGSERRILPNEARIRNLTYSAPMFVEMSPVMNGVEGETIWVNFGDLPLMLKSKICPLSTMSRDELIDSGEDADDPGGYFIINGTERILVLVEEIAQNKAIAAKVSTGSSTDIIRIHSEKDGYVQRHILERKKNGILTISFANVNKLPVAVLLKALGLESDKDILTVLSDDPDVHEEFYLNLYEVEVSNSEDGLDRIGLHIKIPQPEYRKERATRLVDRYLLPHLGQDPKNRMDKAIFLAKAVNKLIKLHLGKIEEDDLDHYSNKRLRLSGDLLEILLRSILLGKWGLITRITYNYQKLTKRGRVPPLQAIVETNVLTNQLNSALAIGSWVGGRTGVSQRLERGSYIKTMSHMRNVLSPLTSTQEHFEARELHPTHWGKLCTSETPEGATIGLRKYLAIMAEVTKGVEEDERKAIEKVLKEHIITPEKLLKAVAKQDKDPNGKSVDVFWDGKYLGQTYDPEKLVNDLKLGRRTGKLSNQINVCYYPNLNELRILSDSGRVRRPAIVVENGNSKMIPEIVEKLKKGEIGWESLLKQGIIEYLDADEEEETYICLYEHDLTTEHTHLELDPSIILGLSASFIPFTEFNRGDRVNYGAKMVGQSMGVFATNYQIRADTKANVLVYPQKPMVETHGHKIINYDQHPNGSNVVIAIGCFDGYNMEDAIVINKGSIQRGLFWSLMMRNYEAIQKRYMGGQEDIIGIPDPGVRGYAGEDVYKHLPEDGIINPETVVNSDDVLVGRVSPLRFLGTMDQFITGIENIRETSVRIRHEENGVVDRVFLSETKDGTMLIKVIVRDMKIPEIGDKFASRHGQKGVIGLIVPEEDMPFTETGIVPDLIFNSHGIPSRMTMGQLLEFIGGKLGAVSGTPINARPFHSMKEELIRSELETYGFRNDGKETMYDGRTGKRFNAQVFIGSCFYQKLDHLVSNKIHARSRGPVALLTKQPTEGRSKEGGLRLGEMEKDVLIAHGAALTLKERFDSDKTTVPICLECGMSAVHDHIKNRNYCPVCGTSKIVEVEMSYAFKLMLDELKSMMIYPKLVVKLGNNLVDRIEFNVLGPDIIRKMVVAKITKTDLYDQEGYPIEGGLMDPRLGVVDPGVRCRVCAGRVGDCHGHFGYLDLTRPIVHVHYAKFIFSLLKLFCPECSRIMIDNDSIEELKDKKYTIRDIVKMTKKKCPHCGSEQKKLKFIKPYTFQEGKGTLNAIDLREKLEKILDEDLKLIGVKIRPEWLILTILPISPVTVRPSITLETGDRSEDDLTHKLVDIVRINERLRENIDLGAPEFIIDDLWELLQYHISTYFDNEISGVPPARHRSGRILKTLSQRLKTKEGRFRGNLAGKRVNFSARTVVSPDPMINIDEVGVPESIAKELTLPVRVNDNNKEDLKKIILNGSDNIEGANYVIRPDGRRKKITDLNKAEISEEIDMGYIVERHLRDDDIVLFNRQPSLHRMSIMAHRVRVMPYKTFRLNVAVCPPYNADFDGDEMNLHVPQTEEAQAEAKFLMAVHKNIRSPRFSGPIIGAHRDYISGLYYLTNKERKFEREEAVQMIRSVDVNLDIPNKKTLTGKEIFSMFLPKGLDIELRAKACIGCDKCSKRECKEDAYVVIENGKLIHGTIDGASVGAFSGKVLDKIEKDYGAEIAKKFIFDITRISIQSLMTTFFSISISDQDLSEEARSDINKTIKNVRKDVDDLIDSYSKGEIKILPGRTAKESLESHIKRRLNKSIDEIEDIIEKHIKDNFTVMMARSGSRGSLVNLVQTAAMVGQEMAMGERIERGYADRTFPHFKKGDISLESRGFVGRGFKDGLTPFEFFFDAINSRESLMDKSLKTRHSGYMERRLVGALQDLKIEYDGTVRDSAKHIIQFLPGEDGMDPSKIRRTGIDIEKLADSIK